MAPNFNFDNSKKGDLTLDGTKTTIQWFRNSVYRYQLRQTFSNFGGFFGQKSTNYFTKYFGSRDTDFVP